MFLNYVYGPSLKAHFLILFLDFLLYFFYYLCLWLYFHVIWFNLSITFIICVKYEVYLKKGSIPQKKINWEKLFWQRNISIFWQTCKCISQQFSIIFLRFTTIEIMVINNLVGYINVTKLCVWSIFKSSFPYTIFGFSTSFVLIPLYMAVILCCLV